MLKLFKNKFVHGTSKARFVLFATFAVTMMVGFGLPYFGFGASSTAQAASTVISAEITNPTTTVGSATSNPAVTYEYQRMSLREVYPYYISASFMIAAGLSLYAVTYVPSRAERRSRYVSRFETWARTTY